MLFRSDSDDEEPPPMIPQKAIALDIPPVPAMLPPPIPLESNQAGAPPGLPPLQEMLAQRKLLVKKAPTQVAVEAPKQEQSMLNQIQSFKFQAQKKVRLLVGMQQKGDTYSQKVVQPKQLPKQNQDSLTEILASQLASFRTKLRADLNDEEPNDDDWE